jgi:hypothetical protein
MLSRPRKSLQGSEQLATLPAPTGGINTFSPAMGMPATDCVLLKNMVAAEYGLRARLGWRDWNLGLTGATDSLVRTVIPYTGSNPTATRLFVTTSSGIWDVTDSGFAAGSAYAAATSYTAGTSVTLGGEDYICVSAGTSHAGGAPPAWAANTVYRYWDMVTSSGNVYCLAYYLEATSGSALMAPSGAADFTDTEGSFYWTYVGPSGGISNNKGLPAPWAALTAYTVGAAVIFEGRVYHCADPGTSGATEPVSVGSGYGDNVTDGGIVWSPGVHDGAAYGSAFFTTQSSDSIPDGTATWKYAPDNAAPALVCAFSDVTGDAGYGVKQAHTTTTGNFIWYADEQNGLFLYTESTDTWTAVSAASITGVDPADLVFVTTFKGFTLFAERNKTDIWILGVNSISGAASRLGTGYKLQAGGDIVGMWSWTYDGGAGLDDALVVVSRGGDVMVWQGSDPTDSTLFGMTGVWGVGKMPAGRDVATTFGGDLLLLTRSGVQAMSKLVIGRATGAVQYETAKVQNLFNSYMLSRGDMRGWNMVLHPEEAALVVTVPVATGTATTQLVMSLSTRSWSEFRDLDIYSCAAHEGKLYFGTTDGGVRVNMGTVDGVRLYDADAYEAVQYSGISAFQNLGSGTQKQVHLIRPRFLSDSSRPSFSVGARYDFNLSELSEVTYSASTDGSVWDTGLWDTATWGDSYAPTSAIRGATGMGANVAIVWRGASVDRAVLVGFELSYSVGGML